MIVDGTRIALGVADAVRLEIEKRSETPRIMVLTSAPTSATKQFLLIKKAYAEKVGAMLDVVELSSQSSTDEVVSVLKREADGADGIIVQLPLPLHIDIDAVLAAVPFEKDVDAIGHEMVGMLEEGSAPVLPPVVAAIREIAEGYGISFTDKKVAVVGSGRLVGRPAAMWARQQSKDVSIYTKEMSEDAGLSEFLQDADILILGAGVPGLVSPDMLKKGVVIFDAGTSEDGGKIKGDALPECAEKAALFTPVPGGIGPVAVSMIFKNLVTLCQE